MPRLMLMHVRNMGVYYYLKRESKSQRHLCQ